MSLFDHHSSSAPEPKAFCVTLDNDYDFYEPTEEHEIEDSWHDRVEALAMELNHSAPNAPYNNLRRVAADIVDGKITHKEGVQRLTSKKLVIKKK